MDAIKIILHPTDFSVPAGRAFELACMLAEEHNSHLIVLHVEEPPETIMGEFGMIPPPPRNTAELEHKLLELQPPVPISIEYQLREGNPAEQIIDAARECRADLIVMGTHGRSGLQHVLVGSVTERVVREAPCSVRTVTAAAQEAAQH